LKVIKYVIVIKKNNNKKTIVIFVSAGFAISSCSKLLNEKFDH
jgi:hypothetical protein